MVQRATRQLGGAMPLSGGGRQESSASTRGTRAGVPLAVLGRMALPCLAWLARAVVKMPSS